MICQFCNNECSDYARNIFECLFCKNKYDLHLVAYIPNVYVHIYPSSPNVKIHFRQHLQEINFPIYYSFDYRHPKFIKLPRSFILNPATIKEKVKTFFLFQ